LQVANGPCGVVSTDDYVHITSFARLGSRSCLSSRTPRIPTTIQPGTIRTAGLGVNLPNALGLSCAPIQALHDISSLHPSGRGYFTSSPRDNFNPSLCGEPLSFRSILMTYSLRRQLRPILGRNHCIHPPSAHSGVGFRDSWWVLFAVCGGIVAGTSSGDGETLDLEFDRFARSLSPVVVRRQFAQNDDGRSPPDGLGTHRLSTTGSCYVRCNENDTRRRRSLSRTKTTISLSRIASSYCFLSNCCERTLNSFAKSA
jgi:hypothetical protein